MTQIEKLLEIMAALRDPQSGCPWDIEQTFASIAPYTVEEAYEVADAIERGNTADLRDELGDLLLQVVFHAQMANEAGLFDFTDVAATISDKLVRRHPHVFADADSGTPADRQRDWEAHKRQERESAGKSTDSVLNGITPNLPALTLANKTSRRAATVGFDWHNADEVVAKIHEELNEVAHARQTGGQAEIADEVGDLLLAVTNLARKLDVDPEQALRNANRKFARRFREVERELATEGINWSDCSINELEAKWQAAKQRLG